MRDTMAAEECQQSREQQQQQQEMLIICAHTRQLDESWRNSELLFEEDEEIRDSASSIKMATRDVACLSWLCGSSSSSSSCEFMAAHSESELRLRHQRPAAEMQTNLTTTRTTTTREPAPTAHVHCERLARCPVGVGGGSRSRSGSGRNNLKLQQPMMAKPSSYWGANKRAMGPSSSYKPNVGQMVGLVVLLLFWLFATSRRLASGAKLPDIYWNSSNPIFRIDNTDHIFDVNKKQHDHDQVDLVCPQQQQPLAAFESGGLLGAQTANRSTGQNETAAQLNAPASSQERYIIYSVSKEEYDTCRLNGKARVVARCDQQQGKSRPPFTVTFRSFTPQPNGLEFKAGEDYYFITGLIGDHLDPNKRFSPCREQNMRVIFKVCCKAQANQGAASASTSASSAAAAAAAAAASAQPGAQIISSEPASSPGRSQQQQQQQLGSSTGASVTSPHYHRPSQPNSNAALAAASTRRPSVITLRPSLMVQPSSQVSTKQSQQQIHNQPQNDDYLRALREPFASINLQQQQPITVLPIEVLQPQSTESPAASGGSSSEQPGGSDSERNDIVQNEQQQQQQPPPQQQASHAQASSYLGHILRTTPSSSFRQPLAQPDRLSGFVPHQQLPAFVPFDRTAPPEVIKSWERWAPTPLPPRLTKQQQQQPQQLEPEPWHLPPHSRPPIQRQAPDPATMGQSRKIFYPHTVWSQYEQPTSSSGSLITADGQQQNSGTNSREAGILTLGVSLLAGLMMLLIQQALGPAITRTGNIR